MWDSFSVWVNVPVISHWAHIQRGIVSFWSHVLSSLTHRVNRCWPNCWWMPLQNTIEYCFCQSLLIRLRSNSFFVYSALAHVLRCGREGWKLLLGSLRGYVPSVRGWHGRHSLQTTKRNSRNAEKVGLWISFTKTKFFGTKI